MSRVTAAISSRASRSASKPPVSTSTITGRKPRKRSASRLDMLLLRFSGLSIEQAYQPARGGRGAVCCSRPYRCLRFVTEVERNRKTPTACCRPLPGWPCRSRGGGPGNVYQHPENIHAFYVARGGDCCRFGRSQFPRGRGAGDEGQGRPDLQPGFAGVPERRDRSAEGDRKSTR